MALDLNAVMDAIGVRLATITGLRVADYPSDMIAPPAAVVGLPAEVIYDHTKGRGTDRMTIPVTIALSKVNDRNARDQLGAYLAGTGASSIKTAVDGTLGGICNAAVSGARGDFVSFNGVEYVAALFDIEVWD